MNCSSTVMKSALFNLSVNVCEMFILVIAFLSLLILLYVVITVADFHYNFRVLLVLLVGIFLVCVVDFFSLVTMKLFAPQGGLARVVWLVLYVIHDVITPSYTFAFMLLVAERLIATRWAGVYEKHGNHQSLTLTLACIAAILFGISMSLYFHLSGDGQTHVYVVLIALTAVDACDFVISLYLLHRNKQMFQVKFAEGTHSLSKRYQISENIKLARLLAPILVMEILVNVTSLAPIIYYLVILPYDRNKDYHILGYIIDFDISIFITVFPWMILLRHPPYYRKIRSMMPCAVNADLEKTTEPTNVNGQAIVIHETSKIHFENLKKNWF